MNELQPKNIQISKELKIKDLKEKILRSCKEFLDEKANYNINLYLYPFGYKDKKQDVFELIYSYKNCEKNFSVPVEEVIDDDLIIEVLFILLILEF